MATGVVGMATGVVGMAMGVVGMATGVVGKVSSGSGDWVISDRWEEPGMRGPDK